MAKSEESKCCWCNHRSELMFPVLGAMGGPVDCFQSCRHKCMGITVVAAAGPEEEEISHC